MIKYIYGGNKSNNKEVVYLPRQARVISESGMYHIILRGINKQDIFFDNQDRYKFMNELIKTKDKYDYELITYCLMPNHVHFEIVDKNSELSKIMQTLTISYSSYFNKKYDRVGHLFQNRYFSKPIETEAYLLKLHRYIHQNPVKAGISNLNNYRWSSYKTYIYGEDDKVTDTKLIKSYFDTMKELKDFNNENIKYNYGDILEFEIRKRFTDDEVINILKQQLKIDNIQDVQKYNKAHREAILKDLKNITGINCAQVSRVLGINKKIIERTLKK